MIEIYTDGSCKNNGNNDACGGWGFIAIINSDEEEPYAQYGGEKSTTNNRMEMTAMIEACKYYEELLESLNEGDSCIIYTDSAYIHNCISQNWWKKWINNNWVNSKKEPVKNKDLWEKLIPYFLNKNFSFRKIKGHAGYKYNEIADLLANAGAKFAREYL